jgi:hypothetical protein
MARCKIYEIQGADASSTAGAVRCHRHAVKNVEIDGEENPVCKRHRGVRWDLFRKDGRPYAVDLIAEHP